MTSSAPRVLVVDRHRVFAEVIAQQLLSAPGIGDAHVAFSVREARVLAEHRSPDVVLLNPELEGESGFELLHHLDTLPSTPRVVVVSDRNEPSAVVRGLVLGVRGWVSKDARFDDLMHAIDAVHRGNLHLPPAAWRPVVLELLNARTARSARNTFISRLTERQRAVLRCLLAGMSRAEIATALKVSPHTVRTHVRDMFRVVGVHSTPQLVAQARAAGLTGPTPRGPAAR